ncbi:ABC transporter substrate-binding protein [Schlesneria sp. T3-172]|uniref:ABC transporter substrate-binding protein n=1 Tax=Schlesneria sphaerica TaxID=3373610 RepID=UPI0037C74A6B
MNVSRGWLTVALCLAIGCQAEKPTSLSDRGDDGSSGQSQLIDVSLALNWFPEAEHGGYYAALVHGYYEEEGLRVTIRPGGPKVPVISDVAEGKVDFGVDNADKLLLLRAQQAEVVAVMSPLQNSPRCIMVHKSSGLTKLEDLAQKKSFTLAMNSGQPFAQYLKKVVNLDGVQVVNYPGNVAQFLEQTDYGQQAYSFSEPFLAEREKSDPLCLMLSDIGFNAYTSLLIARQEAVSQKPDLVARMTRASIKGWKKYLAEPDQTNKYIHEQNPEMGMEILAYGVNALRPLCLPTGFDETQLGMMTAERWQTLTDQMGEIGLIKPGTIKSGETFSLAFLKTEPATKPAE